MTVSRIPGIFVVERDQTLSDQICVALSGMRWPLQRFHDVRYLLPRLHPATSGCVISSIEPPDYLLSLHEALIKSKASLALILLTPHIEIPDAVSVMRAGADDLIQLPLIDRVLRVRVGIFMQKLQAGH